MSHIPVMLEETILGLNIKPNGIYIDGTVGLGGHSAKIASKLTDGKLICFDLDDSAIMISKEMLKPYADKVIFIHDNFKNAIYHLDKLKIDRIDGLLLDLGVSSMQIDTPSRGFSYINNGPIDMRMDIQSQISAMDVVNNYSEADLIRIFYEYGEEKLASRIARKICQRRMQKKLETTSELTQIIIDCYPTRYKDGHPAKRVFQALRIYVNEELNGLYQFILDISKRTNSYGRLVIISFHSLEDRIVKNAFIYLKASCICHKSMPICTCNKEKEVNVITKKPLVPSNAEIMANSRASSAKLRIAEKI